MNQHSLEQSEITFHHEPAGNTKRIWKTFWILSIITLVELACGYWIYTIHRELGGTFTTPLVMFLKGAIIILTLAKAYYIVAIFMHLGDEIRNFIMTIVVPLMLFIWFILAFLMDGAHWRNMRNTNSGIYEDTHQQVKPAPVKAQEKP